MKAEENKLQTTCSKMITWSAKQCPVYLSKDPRCWIIHGIHYVGGKTDILSEIRSCVNCEVFKSRLYDKTILDKIKDDLLSAFDIIIKDDGEVKYNEVRKRVYSPLTEEQKTRYRFGNIIGKSEPMQHIYNMIKPVAQSDLTVLITGESGTGKDLLAKAIHYNSPRANGKFIAVNCGVLAEGILESELFGHMKGAFTGAVINKKGKFELANNGTLFLDEIAETSLNFQVKLLRVIEEKKIQRVGGVKDIPINTRIIAATNKNLEELIKEGKFREDLYYRLKVVTLSLPPLRERKEDILLLMAYFLKKIQKNRVKKRISPEALEILVNYEWPGNVRELENAIEYAALFTKGNIITPEHLPPDIVKKTKATPPKDSSPSIESLSYHEAKKRIIDNFNKRFLTYMLFKNKGNISRAAKEAGIRRETMQRMIKKYGISYTLK